MTPARSIPRRILAHQFSPLRIHAKSTHTVMFAFCRASKMAFIDSPFRRQYDNITLVVPCGSLDVVAASPSAVPTVLPTFSSTSESASASSCVDISATARSSLEKRRNGSVDAPEGYRRVHLHRYAPTVPVFNASVHKSL